MARHHLDLVYAYLCEYYEAHQKPPTTVKVAEALNLTYGQANRALFYLYGQGRVLRLIPTKYLPSET